MLRKNLVFIDSMQFVNSSFEKLVKNLQKSKFEYLSYEFSKKQLEVVKQKGHYLYHHINKFERFDKTNLSKKEDLNSTLKEISILVIEIMSML